MHPILTRWPFEVHWYGVFVAIGFLVAYWLFQKRAANLGLSEKETSNLIMLLFVSGILGGRIYYIFLDWDRFVTNPGEVLLSRSGFVFFGGFLMAVFALFLWSRAKQRPLAPIADALAPPLALGHMFGRLGCFMEGCCYGKPSSYFWAVRPEAPPEVAGIAIHPTQIYEAIGLLDIFLTLLVMERMPRYPGKIAWSYCILYSVFRFIVEFFRGDVPHTYLGRFTLAQIVCMGVFVVAWIASSRMAYKTAKMRGKRALEALQSEIKKESI